MPFLCFDDVEVVWAFELMVVKVERLDLAELLLLDDAARLEDFELLVVVRVRVDVDELSDLDVVSPVS